MSYEASLRGLISQRRGRAGEQEVALPLLRSKGVRMIEYVMPPYNIVESRNGGWVRIQRTQKASGDWRGVLPGGIRVLAEVKTTKEERLPFSRLRKHQVEKLNENDQLGAVSLLIFVSSYGVACARWPIPGFGPGTSLHIEEAQRYEWEGYER